MAIDRLQHGSRHSSVTMIFQIAALVLRELGGGKELLDLMLKFSVSDAGVIHLNGKKNALLATVSHSRTPWYTSKLDFSTNNFGLQS